MKKKEKEKWSKILGGGFVLFLILSYFGVIPPIRLGANYDINGDGDIDHLDLKYCVVNEIDCDYPGIVNAIRKAGGYPLSGLADDCTSAELDLMDANGDCFVSDVELLTAIDSWSLGRYTDQCLLSVIEIWMSGAPSPEIPGCEGVTTTTTLPTTTTTTTAPPTTTTSTLPPTTTTTTLITTTTLPPTTTTTLPPTTTTTTIPIPPKPPLIKVFEDFVAFIYSIFNTIIGFIF